MNRPLFVSEIFGPTCQGEGPSAGRPAVFLRLMGCNLHCTWCDTPYTWDHRRFRLAQETVVLTAAQTQDALAAHGAPLLVVSGGEPLLQAEALAPVLAWAQAAFWDVEIETNGTLPPPLALVGAVDAWNISPKLAHSGNDRARAWRDGPLRQWAREPHARFKFVCATPADLPAIEHFVAAFDVEPEAIWLMPEGVTAEAVLAGLRWLGPEAVARGYNVTSRLHVLIWGNDRGH